MKLFGNHRSNGDDLREDLEEELDDYDADYDEDYDDEDYDEDYDDEYDEDEYEDEGEDEGGRLSRKKVVLLSVLAAVVLVFGAIALSINYFLNLINYQAANSDYFATVSREEDLPEETAINEKLAALDEEEQADSLEATEEELAQMNEHLESVTSDSETYEVPISEDVYNILLIGSDTRTAGSVGRSDAMILVSINQKTKKIYLTSFLRDCYVHIPGYGNTRLNHAFAYGGPALLEETLEENFKVHVDRYVAVDFFSFMDVIDVLGGIWMDVSEDEQEITNDYIWSMNNLMGEEWSNDYLWNSGYQKLNGKQALCYARNRYTGNDYERTQRQRNIINEVINQALDSSPATLVDLAQVILPQITTDMEKSEILTYAANAAAYMNYEVVSQQIPASGTYSSATISGMSVITLDLEDNIEYLQGTIYAGTEYGSDTVITQDADDYGTTNTDDEDTDFLGTAVDAEEAVPKPSMVTKPRG
jgi:LCP family protein required for cell wall assembly